jgi:hypothetical protein
MLPRNHASARIAFRGLRIRATHDLSEIVNPKAAALVITLEHADIDDGIRLRRRDNSRCQDERRPHSSDHAFHRSPQID